jgi:hypothetical protein
VPDKVLIVTGGMLSADEPSLFGAVRKQLAAIKASSGAWLDVQQKILAAEHLVASERHRKGRAFKAAPYRDAVDRFFANEDLRAPELTEVSLMSLLHAEGVQYEASTYAEL